MSLSDDVFEVLTDPVVAAINFMLHGVPVRGDLFRAVAEVVRHGAIRVEHDRYARGAGEAGRYNQEHDRMALAFDRVRTLRDRAIVVHEAVHAGNDLLARPVFFLDDEAAGYVAEAWYCAAHKQTITSADANWAAVYQAAHAVAAEFRSGRLATPAQLDALSGAILRGGFYQEEFDHNYGIRSYNGVRLPAAIRRALPRVRAPAFLEFLRPRPGR
jgi:hypothetical protein